MITNLPKMPIALSGVALGVAGITGAWAGVLVNPTVSIIGAIIATTLITPVIFKYALHPHLFTEEISHPTLGSVIPTLDMAIMLISAVIVNYIPILGKGLWIVAAITHIFLCVRFFYIRIKDFDINHMLPSWFIPPIGIVVACVSSSEMGFGHLAEIFFYIGLWAYVIMLPLMFYRLFFGDKIEDVRLPAFGVMGAPANLCLAGYLTAFSDPNYYMATSLAYMGIFITFLVYVSMFRVFRIKFTPLFASYTFPLGIGATAMIKYTNYLKTTPTPDNVIQVWQNIANVELLIASAVILFVFINLKIFIWKSIKNNQS